MEKERGPSPLLNKNQEQAGIFYFRFIGKTQSRGI